MAERFLTTYNSGPGLPDNKRIVTLKEENGIDLNDYDLVTVVYTPGLTDEVNFTFYWELS